MWKMEPRERKHSMKNKSEIIGWEGFRSSLTHLSVFGKNDRLGSYFDHCLV